MKTHDLNLHTIAGGALPEKFAHAVKRLLDNIMDLNTDAEAKRKISIEITFAPDKNARESVTATVSVKTKLAAAKADAGQVYIGRRGQEIVAVTANPRQPGLFDTEDGADAVRPISPQQQQEAG